MSMWSPDVFMNKLYRDTVEKSYDRTAGGGTALVAKQEELRRRLSAALGTFPEQPAPLEPELLETFRHEGLIVEKLAYSTFEGLRVPVYALYPEVRSGRLPAVLACHGHGIGQRAALGMNPDGTFAQDPGIHNRFAVQLAQRGMFVLVPEILGFGDRRLREAVEADPEAKTSSCAPISNLLMLCGMTIAGFRVYEARRALDYLASRQEADPQRIGALGFSGGGLVASMAAALDPRIRATIICGYTNTFEGSILDRPHCIDNYVPGILHLAEQPELMGLMAPRPLFVESGLDDKVFPVESTREAIGRLQALYRSFGAEERLQSDLFPGKHEISGRHSFDWLREQLEETIA
ncbi:alpha/beta hydrolase family protein [Gorillibacterium sp. sgz5001074]|uniref:alpha/beta hydrolase family protein n=1 Tax=Gorillibacterium sp. sgz5001074 TaxID=3446695 RepID=UPI003F66E04F